MDNPVYHNLRYRFQYRNQLYMGLTAEKMMLESLSFVNTIKKGYDFYSAYFFLTGRKEVEVVGDR